MITLITGEKVVVRETLETVIDAAHDWRVHVLRDTLANTDVSAEVAEVAHLVAVNGTAASACVAHHSKMHAVSEHHSK
jgi:alkylhydroperoxidase family enzyme